MVGHEEVVSVVLGDIEDTLTYNISEIRRSLMETYGTTCKKDFLKPNSDSSVVKRRVNDWKRFCFAFYAKHIPKDILEQLKLGKNLLFVCIAIILYTRFLCEQHVLSRERPLKRNSLPKELALTSVSSS